MQCGNCPLLICSKRIFQLSFFCFTSFNTYTSICRINVRMDPKFIASAKNIQQRGVPIRAQNIYGHTKSGMMLAIHKALQMPTLTSSIGAVGCECAKGQLRAHK